MRLKASSVKNHLPLFFIFAFLLSLSFVGCKNQTANQTKENTNSQAQQSKTDSTENKNSESTKAMNNKVESPFACEMSALNKDEKKRVLELLETLKTNIKEVKELPDGYALRLPLENQLLRDTAEFITYERLCCPFFDFELVIDREGGPMWLRLKGREGVKDFIRMEFDLK